VRERARTCVIAMVRATVCKTIMHSNDHHPCVLTVAADGHRSLIRGLGYGGGTYGGGTVPCGVLGVYASTLALAGLSSGMDEWLGVGKSSAKRQT
jgi:hypothetical protein